MFGLEPLQPSATAAVDGSSEGAKRRRIEETAEAEESSTLHGVRPENAQNILLLRIGQKRVLQALEEQAEQCFAD
ncbi:N-lysine methyltransferase SETD6 [Durusdinium trenchii]|uniref:N-lysine methyltransferase SETD6 n=1 Tax=Durusdinium trenchii TaxID=1381693 RepID=A0ABP0Q1R5_9DINO